MSQFIKLSSIILNKNLINTIRIHPNKYHIYTMENNINGAMLFGSGQINSNPEKIVICEKQDPEDYKIMSNWINTL